MTSRHALVKMTLRLTRERKLCFLLALTCCARLPHGRAEFALSTRPTSSKRLERVSPQHLGNMRSTRRYDSPILLRRPVTSRTDTARRRNTRAEPHMRGGVTLEIPSPVTDGCSKVVG